MDFRGTHFLPFTALARHGAAGEPPVFTGRSRRAIIVGYQNKALDAKFNFVVNTFVPVGANRAEMTFGDIKPNEDFVNSQIQLLTSGGATANVTVDGLGTKRARFIYWTEDDGPEDGEGWYLDSDDDAEYNQNSRVIPFGDGYLVDRSTGEPNAALVFAGEVQDSPVTKELQPKFNFLGNCCPRDITFGDVTPNEDFVNSQIQLLTSGGATANVTVDGLGTKRARFIYWTEDDGAEDGAGWYLDSDDDAEYNQNSRVISAGSGFLVDRSTGEPNATITLPKAL